MLHILKWDSKLHCSHQKHLQRQTHLGYHFRSSLLALPKYRAQAVQWVVNHHPLLRLLSRFSTPSSSSPSLPCRPCPRCPPRERWRRWPGVVVASSGGAGRSSARASQSCVARATATSIAAMSSQQRRLWWSSVATKKSWSWELLRLEVQSSAKPRKTSSLHVGATLRYEKPDATFCRSNRWLHRSPLQETACRREELKLPPLLGPPR
jgi:hypothetical protein